MDGLVAELVEGAERGDERRRRAGRRGRGGRLHEGAPGRVAPRADREDRARRDQGRSARTASPRPRTRRSPPAPTAASSPPTPRSSASAARRSSSGRPSATRPRSRRRSTKLAEAAARRVAEHHAGDDRGREGGRDHRRVGADPARRVRRLPRPDRRLGGGRAAATRSCSRAIRERVDELAERIGHRPRILVGKPGLDGHSNGAEQIAVRARDVGMEVIYQGIRLTPEQIAASARRRGRRRRRPLDPLRLAPRADPRDGAAAARAGRRRAGRGRRDHPARRRREAARGRASPASTRRRTSTSTGSWARSSTSSARARAGDGGAPPGLSPPPIEFPVEGLSDGVVRLRLMADADVPAVVEAVQDPEIPRCTTVPSPYGEDEARQWQRAVEHRAGAPGPTWRR